MPGNPKLIVDIITDASKAGKGIDDATGKFGKFNTVMGNLVGPATAVLGGITALGVGAINAASDLQQAAGGTEAVFGSSAAQIEKWASTAATSVGLSSAAYQTFAAQIGSQLKNLGVPMDQVAGKTDEMIRLGADLAATYGGTTADAVSALGSAFRGEADPAERYGLALNQTAVNAELAARGQSELQGSALTAAKAQIVMEMATKQAGDAVGQFARESDTLAGQQQVLQASIADMAAELGTALLPVITPVVAALADMAKWIQENSGLVTLIIGIIGALAAAVIAYTVAQWAANIAMAANPVGLVIAGIILLIGVIAALGIWIANHTKEIRGFFEDLWSGIQSIVKAVADWFVAIWSSVTDRFRQGWEQIASFFRGMWAGIQSVVGTVAGWFTSVWTGTMDRFRAGWQQIASFFTSLWSGIQSVVGAVANAFASAWQSAINSVASVINWLGSIFAGVFNGIQGAINGIVGAFNAIVGAIQNVINWIGRIKIPDVFGAIGGLLGGASATVATAGFASPAVFSARGNVAAPSAAVYGASGAGGTVINVYGGLDSSDAIARRIQSVLSDRDRRSSGVNLRRRVR